MMGGRELGLWCEGGRRRRGGGEAGRRGVGRLFS